MGIRDEFEAKFPVPEGIEWIDERQEYRITSDDDHWFDKDGWADFCNYLGRWKGWQAARAQGGQGADAVKWSDPAVDPIVSKLYRKFKEWNRQGFGADDVTWCEVRGYVAELLNAQPQPAVPEGWRECLQEMVQAMYDYEMSVEEDAPYKHRAMMDRAHALLSTPTTPQADGWVLVPADHLPEVMEKAAVAAAREYTARTGGNCMKTIYKALVNAAPQPPAGQEGA